MSDTSNAPSIPAQPTTAPAVVSSQAPEPVTGSPVADNAPAPALTAPSGPVVGDVVAHTHESREGTPVTTRGVVLDVLTVTEKDKSGDNVDLDRYVVGWFSHVSDPLPVESFDS